MKSTDLLNEFVSTLVPEIAITGLALDSRKVLPGNIFFACQGTRENGADYVEDVIKKGAVLILADQQDEKVKASIPIIRIKNLAEKIGFIAAKFYNNPSQHLSVIGITGTNGKTSCAHFIASALHQAGKVCGVIGTIGNGLYGNIQPAGLTTPDAVTLQKTFSEYLSQGAQYTVMEVSSHSLDQKRVDGTRFAVGIFTNLTRDHLDYHETMEKYGAAKQKLFEAQDTYYSIINADDEFGLKIINELHSHKKIIAYGLKRPSLPEGILYVHARNIQIKNEWMIAQIDSPWGKGELRTHLIGKFNISNLLAVLTTLNLLNFSFNDALDLIAKLIPVEGRMQSVGGKDQPLVIIDYSHTPDALEKALGALREHCRGRVICVFGCGGDRDRGKRPMMAAIAEKFSDKVIVTDDNPRTENSAQIFNDITKGFLNPSAVMFEHDRASAIRLAIQQAAAEDCVLIAGKGAETYQIIGTEKFPFSDIENALLSLRGA